jgi:MFS family permease
MSKNTLWLSLICTILLLVLLPFSSYVVSVPLIQPEWQLSNAQSGFVFSAYLVGVAVSSLLFVPLTDKYATQRIFLIGVMVTAVSHFAFAFLARDLGTGMAFRFLAGVGHAMVYVPGIQLVSQYFADGKRATAVSAFVSAGYAGTTLSYSFMGQLLKATESWQVAYAWTAVAAVIGIPLTLLMNGMKRETRDWKLETNHSPLPTLHSRPKGRLDLSVLRHKPTALVIVAYTLHTAELYLARLWFPLLLGAMLLANGRTSLEATAEAGTLSGFMFMLGIIGVMIGGWLSDQVGRATGGAIVFAISGVCSFAAGWLIGLPPGWLIGLGFVYGLMTAADSAIYATAVTELAAPDCVGSAQAVQSFVGFAVGAAVPVLAGSILDTSNTTAAWGWAFSFNGILALIGVLSLLWLRRLPYGN